MLDKCLKNKVPVVFRAVDRLHSCTFTDHRILNEAHRDQILCSQKLRSEISG
jgi:hypothetical protein